MTNLENIQQIIEYIELHLLDEKLDLDTLSKVNGYSKYHLHRLFSSIVNIPIHTYVQRRRLTLGAHMLVFTDKPIIEIALSCGYETQQSFTRIFKSMYNHSPNHYRKHKNFMPIQLPYEYSPLHQSAQNLILDIQIISEDQLLLAGFDGNTKHGFRAIGKCWHQMHKYKSALKNRTDLSYLIGVNDYSEFEQDDSYINFHYIAAARIHSFDFILKNMKTFILPASQYIIFYLRGKNEESMQPIIEYIYKVWFPQSNYQFNKSNRYDFIKYGEDIDDLGQSKIQFWLPIL